MNGGFYKQYREILGLLRSGKINLLMLGIYTYLCLSANMVLGNGYDFPAGVVSTSAIALRAHFKRVSERTFQRALNRMEKVGLIKFSTWRKSGEHGNYEVLICRASVHDLSGREFQVNGTKTTDWRYPVYESVADLSQNSRRDVGEVATYREVEKEKKEKKNLAATTAPHTDNRYQQFLGTAFEAFRAQCGQSPTWSNKEFKGLSLFLAKQGQIELAEWQRRFQNFMASTDEFVCNQGGSILYFLANFDKFIRGPILGKGGGSATNGQPNKHESFDERRRRENAEAIRNAYAETNNLV